jgi:sterol desaturase/sphingolipid hydroxylase (fatty acid hydroxylase superfamily)
MNALREAALAAPWFMFAIVGPLVAFALVGLCAALTRLLGRGRPLLQPDAAPRSVPAIHALYLRINLVQLGSFGALKLYVIPRLPNIHWGAPTLLDTVVAAIAAILLTDLTYWAFHRLMHTELLWPLHRVHHDVLAPRRASDTYDEHPLDFFVGSILTLLPLAIVPIHIAGLLAAVFVQTLLGIAHHSGRDLPGALGVRGHDLHHSGGHGNYALNFALVDHLCGTAVDDNGDGSRAS